MGFHKMDLPQPGQESLLYNSIIKTQWRENVLHALKFPNFPIFQRQDWLGLYSHQKIEGKLNIRFLFFIRSYS